jgi:hypothetical protein
MCPKLEVVAEDGAKVENLGLAEMLLPEFQS